ncbi:polysaccharide biosynthesis tyrosine autokinase [Ensifer soli]|uniref:polysaccharide biosynthesis tyrosine autokinase n=1 Tax=Ciceribacter sp. sgz301302 TaxID=3342379 RepID=UPI0035BAA6EC
MLQRQGRPGGLYAGEDEAAAGGAPVDLDRLLSAARRQWRVAAAGPLVGLFLGILYLLTAVPLYTARTSLLIDRENRAVADRLSALGGAVDDEATVLSQVELLRSETICLAVVDRLGLADDPAFATPDGALAAIAAASLRAASALLSGDAGPRSPQDRRQAAATRLSDDMAVSRVGRSYVLEIGYTSSSPALSGRIARAIAEAYLADKLSSKYEATRRAGDWLQQRIGALRQRSLETDLAVQRFRTTHGLVASGGTLVTDQQLTELNSALIVAQADTARAEANLTRIRDIVGRGETDAIVTDVLDSAISNTLREKYLDASKREAEIAGRLGPDHAQAARLRGEMREYRRLMSEELGRIAESYRSDLDVARTRALSLKESVAEASGISASANETQVQLRELEREAETYRNLYQTFLQRYQEAVHEQSFPVTEARIISRASDPERASHPRKPLVLALSLLLGAGAGAGFGAFREMRDRAFRTGEQVRALLGQECLGILPRIRDGEEATGAGNGHPRALRKARAIANHVVDHPLSAFAETLRSARLAADLGLPGRPSRVIGVVSVLPGEGKTTVAINFAELLASEGAKAVLVDADLRNPGATRAMARHAQAGLLEALRDGRPVRDLLMVNRHTKLAFLPAVIATPEPHSAELLASAAMAGLLAAAARTFDYVVLDLPPLLPVVDARAIAARIDGFILVVEWGRTARKAVHDTLAAEPRIADKCLGVVLNKVDGRRMALYRDYGAPEYHQHLYEGDADGR